MAAFSPSFAAFSEPVKFSVYRGTAWNSGNNAFALVTFDNENFDTGSNYSVSTGRFTAPIAGFYWVMFNLQTGTSTTNLIGSFYVNGSEVRRYRYNAATATGTGVFGAELLQLSATDYVQVYCFDNATTAMDTGSLKTFFSGFLLSIS